MDNQKGHWITLEGRHIFIRDGESIDDAVKRAWGQEKAHNAKEKQIENNKKQADELNAEKKKQYEPEKTSIKSSQPDNHTKSWKDDLKVPLSFNDFVNQNLDNPDFMKFWKEAKSMDVVRDLWFELRAKEELKNLKEIPLEEAISTVLDSIRGTTLDGWFRESDSSAKPVLIEQIFESNGVLNAGMNIAYHNYIAENRLKDPNFKPLPFNKWLTTPQTVYRGEVDPAYGGKKYGKNDIFMSYTSDKSVADKFANYKGGNVHSIKIRPIDTWGSYQTTREQEFLVPIKHYKK